MNNKPYNIDLEESILATLLLDENAFDEFRGLISCNDFYKTAHQEIFFLYEKAGLKKEKLNLPLVVERLRKKGKLESCGGAVYLAKLTDTVPRVMSAKASCKALKGLALRRQLIISARNIERNAYNLDDSIEVLLSDAKKTFDALNVSENSVVDFYEYQEKCANRYKQMDSFESNRGILTGFYDIDDLN